MVLFAFCLFSEVCGRGGESREETGLSENVRSLSMKRFWETQIIKHGGNASLSLRVYCEPHSRERGARAVPVKTAVCTMQIIGKNLNLVLRFNKPLCRHPVDCPVVIHVKNPIQSVKIP